MSGGPRRRALEDARPLARGPTVRRRDVMASSRLSEARDPLIILAFGEVMGESIGGASRGESSCMRPQGSS